MRKLIIVPLNFDAVLSVAELPTCQKILQALALLISSTLLFTAVVRVEGIWKMNTLFLSFLPSRVTVPADSKRSPSVIQPRRDGRSADLRRYLGRIFECDDIIVTGGEVRLRLRCNWTASICLSMVHGPRTKAGNTCSGRNTEIAVEGRQSGARDGRRAQNRK